MKKLTLFIAFAMLAALTMVSCNNKPQEPTQEEVQEMKQALADSVLAQIDAIANEYFIALDSGFYFRDFKLTEKEKQVKPDYLLDPSEANIFVTESQKVNALAIYAVDMGVRMLYDMPLEETKAAITKLAAEVNFPFGSDQHKANVPLSEQIKSSYEKCKENGYLDLFWQVQQAMAMEKTYILSQNPNLYFSKITDNQWIKFNKTNTAWKNAVTELAKYDEEMATLLEFINKNSFTKSDEKRDAKDSSIESAKQFYTANKDKYIARRNALLQ